MAARSYGERIVLQWGTVLENPRWRAVIQRTRYVTHVIPFRNCNRLLSSPWLKGISMHVRLKTAVAAIIYLRRPPTYDILEPLSRFLEKSWPRVRALAWPARVQVWVVITWRARPLTSNIPTPALTSLRPPQSGRWYTAIILTSVSIAPANHYCRIHLALRFLPAQLLAGYERHCGDQRSEECLKNGLLCAGFWRKGFKVCRADGNKKWDFQGFPGRTGELNKNNIANLWDWY